ncbi:cytochrome c oxidase subunit I [Oxalicibacterium flavum]|uniref:Cytochrome c oxidase subunit I n=1 Tax=Oxalicibacterium flavum TaxID=179467 RepID=A0A8J2UPP3_9BURK|nr:cytochrome C oxidase subunit I [Oxalicibacterium flavum]GGC06940.1 cytochrome c oxidase subunit I [Oxalicibacterium flavum]
MEENRKRKGRWKLLAILLVCASPIIFSYLAYYVFKPEGRTNYGALIDPRAYPLPVLDTRTLDGRPETLDAYKGKWIMLLVAGGDCLSSCEKKLHDIRQLRLSQGKDMERIERVWLITDAQPIDTILIREFDGTHMLRADAERIAAWLPVEQDTTPADHIFMIDPLGNLMMRFPKDADPNRIKKDLNKLLKASSIG